MVYMPLSSAVKKMTGPISLEWIRKPLKLLLPQLESKTSGKGSRSKSPKDKLDDKISTAQLPAPVPSVQTCHLTIHSQSL